MPIGLDTVREQRGADRGLGLGDDFPQVRAELRGGLVHPGARPWRQAPQTIAVRGGDVTPCAASCSGIQHLLAALAEDAGLEMPEIPARNASVWALFFSDSHLAAADYYPALTGTDR